MTFEELREQALKADASKWHQHPNGLGWVENTAFVSEMAFVGKDAIVYGHAQVRDCTGIYHSASIGGHAQICGYARVFDTAHVRGNAKVVENARVYGNAVIRGDACLCGDTEVGGAVRLDSGVWRRTPLQIQGTRHLLFACAPGKVAIGCYTETIKWWLEHYKAIGRLENYSPSEIEEYRLYIELFAKLHTSEEEQQ